jgi:hypothetical protein
MYQFGMRGSRALAARCRFRRRILQQLQFTASQCAAAAGIAAADASTFAGQLPPTAPSAKTSAVDVAAERPDSSSASTDELSPLEFRECIGGSSGLSQ